MLKLGDNSCPPEPADRDPNKLRSGLRPMIKLLPSRWKKITLCYIINVIAIVIGIHACLLGLCASGEAIAEHANGVIWTCKSNAQ